jgi:hypothetical protein
VGDSRRRQGGARARARPLRRASMIHSFFAQPCPAPGRCPRDVSARTRGLEASGLSRTRRRAGSRKARRSVISGECRVDTLPFGDSPNSPAGRKLAIDGLRLRLDLRIVPSAAGGDDAAAAAIWRIENAHLATLPLSITASYRKLAVAAGLGAMLLALGVWFVGPPSAPTTLGEPSSPRAAARELPVAAPSSPLPSSPARTAATREVAPSSVADSPAPVPSAGAAPPLLPQTAIPSVAPRIAAMPASAATPAMPASAATAAPAGAARVDPAVRAPRGEPARPPGLAPGQPSKVRAAAPAGASGVSAPNTSAAAPAAAAGSRSPAPAINPPARPNTARDDMLDLFGDPK